MNDITVKQTLLAAGWRVGIVWECSLRGKGKNIDDVINKITTWLGSDQIVVEING